MSDSPVVTLIVTAHNEAETIAGCLRSLHDQHDAPEFEILLIDDRSTDGTGDVASALGLSRLHIKRLETFQHPILTARQVALDLAIREARGEWILLTDADALVPTDWVRQVLQRLRQTGADALAGRVDCQPDPEGHNRLLAALQTVDSAFYTGICALLNTCGFPSGMVFNHSAFRRAAYLQTGGFESIGFALTEDLSFARALHRQGSRLTFLAKPAVQVRACKDFSEFVKRAHRIGSGGVSILSVSLGLWMIAWLLLALGSIIWPALGTLFLIRHLAGSTFVAFWLLRSRRPDLLPLALIYEPAAIFTGLIVLWDARKPQKVTWGGINYPG